MITEVYHPTQSLSVDDNIYTYVNMYIVFVTPFMGVRDLDQVQK